LSLKLPLIKSRHQSKGLHVQKNRFHAVLFDLDGTLADTLADLANAVNHALAALGCSPHPLAAYRYFVGDGARNLMLRTLPADRKDLADHALRLMRTYYAAHCFDETRLYPGVADLVSELIRRKIKVAVFSNKPDEFTRRMVAHYFPGIAFDAVHGQRDRMPLKPDPTVALHIASELGITPPEWIYLGDTNTDMQTAVAAGMFPVGALWGFREKDELLKSGARMLITKPEELLNLF
jgi:phosphoglycolate phosphatase